MLRKVMVHLLVLCFYFWPEYFGRNTGMMFAAMLAASDLVAILDWLKELGADPRPITIINLRGS